MNEAGFPTGGRLRPLPASAYPPGAVPLGAPDVAERFGPGQWAFTRDVVDVFDDHVRASVPFYDSIQALIAETADWLVPAGGLVADLGCSTGNTSVAIAARQKGREIRFALYDESAAMTARARPAVAEHAGVRVTAHALALPAALLHDKADLTLAVFLLQFLDPPARRQVLADARRAAAPGGALIVAEKLRVHDSRWAEIGQDVSHDYKAQAGVTDTAIRAKARSLRGVLRPVTMEQNMALIGAAGWHGVSVLFRWHSWVVLGAFTDA